MIMNRVASYKLETATWHVCRKDCFNDRLLIFPLNKSYLQYLEWISNPDFKITRDERHP